MALYRQNFHRDAEISDGTKNFYEAGIKGILKTWSGVEALNVRKITMPMVRDWALRMTKNGEPRDVPMIPESRTLLEKIKGLRESESPELRVLRISECRGFLERACKRVGAPRISHHDLRHLFATTAIESGIDILTVAKEGRSFFVRSRT